MRLEVNPKGKLHPIRRSEHSAIDDLGYDGPAEVVEPVEVEVVEFEEPEADIAALFPDIASIAGGLGGLLEKPHKHKGKHASGVMAPVQEEAVSPPVHHKKKRATQEPDSSTDNSTDNSTDTVPSPDPSTGSDDVSGTEADSTDADSGAAAADASSDEPGWTCNRCRSGKQTINCEDCSAELAPSGGASASSGSSGDFGASAGDESVGASGGVEGADAVDINRLRFGIVRLQAVVQMKNLMKPYSPSEGEESYVGSGFIIDIDEEKGPLIVTNAHVVSDAKSVCIQLPANGQECYASTVVLINHDWDLSLVRVQQTKLSQLSTDLGSNTLMALTLASTEQDGAVLAGAKVIAIGFPLGKESLAVTSGTVSGTEVVGETVQIQQDAPISPGNSGGPLIALPSMKVVGVNFASAVAMGSQNNNFAIPAFRVRAMQAEYEANPEKYGVDLCPENIAQCSLKVPPTGVSVVKGNAVIYDYFGCDSGAMVSKVSKRGSFALANPPIEEGSFLTKVDDIELDKFGMGENTKYIQDKVMFTDLLAMNKLGNATVSTCKCGKITTHSVSNHWKAAYNSPVESDDQPNLMKREYVKFANLTLQPLTKSMANKLILSSGEMALIPYIMDDNDKGVIIVTDTYGGELVAGAKRPIAVGSVVTEINGMKVHTMDDLAAAFASKCDGASSGVCTTGAASASAGNATTSPAVVSDGAESTTAGSGAATTENNHPNRESSFQADDDDGDDSEFGGILLQKKEKTACNKVWTMKTHDGKFLAADYVAELNRMVKGDNVFALSDIVKTAMTSEGITVPDVNPDDQPTPAPRAIPNLDDILGALGGGGGGGTGFMEKQNRVMLPIEFRPIYRGGMTASKALAQAVAVNPANDFDLEDEKPARPSSFVQMGPGGLGPGPESLMQIGRKPASSFIQMGPGSLTPESLMQLKRVRATN